MDITFSALKQLQIPFLKPRDTFAVDIGTASVKVLYLKKSGAHYDLHAWGILPISDAGADLSPQDRKNYVVARLAEFIAKEKITTKNVIGSVSGNQVVVRYVKFLKRSREALLKTIHFEAEPYIPFDINEVDLGFHIIGDIVEDGQKKMDAILVAAKKEVGQSRLDIFSDLNLRPVIMDVDAFALVNAYEISVDPTIVETVLLVNIGSSVTNLALIEKHIPRVVRDIFIAGNTFTKSIQKSISCDTQAAEEMKTRYSMLVTAEEKERTLAENQKESIQVSTALTAVARELVQEIQKSIDFYAGQNPEKVVNRILLCGGTSSLKNLDNYLLQELKIPVSIFNPVASFAGGTAIKAEDAARLAVVVGLAIRHENDFLK
jgi:type IV pilus assembly protein PilM